MGKIKNNFILYFVFLTLVTSAFASGIVKKSDSNEKFLPIFTKQGNTLINNSINILGSINLDNSPSSLTGANYRAYNIFSNLSSSHYNLNVSSAYYGINKNFKDNSNIALLGLYAKSNTNFDSNSKNRDDNYYQLAFLVNSTSSNKISYESLFFIGIDNSSLTNVLSSSNDNANFSNYFMGIQSGISKTYNVLALQVVPKVAFRLYYLYQDNITEHQANSIQIAKQQNSFSLIPDFSLALEKNFLESKASSLQVKLQVKLSANLINPYNTVKLETYTNTPNNATSSGASIDGFKDNNAQADCMLGLKYIVNKVLALQADITYQIGDEINKNFDGSFDLNYSF